MIQDQLVEYISAQTKAGTSRDAIRAALVGAGWVAGDVDDSFKKVEGASSPAVSVAAAAAAKSMGSPSKSPEPQMIRMSDLVSASDRPLAVTGASKEQKPAGKISPVVASVAVAGMGVKEISAGRPVSSKKNLIIGIVGIILILLLGAFAGYLYMQNSTLSSKVASLGGASADVTAEISALTSQVNTLTASGTAMGTEIGGLTSANEELAMELSFYALPAGTTPTSTNLSVSGMLSLSASKMYILTASYGGKLSVANSKDATYPPDSSRLLAVPPNLRVRCSRIGCDHGDFRQRNAALIQTPRFCSAVSYIRAPVQRDRVLI